MAPKLGPPLPPPPPAPAVDPAFLQDLIVHQEAIRDLVDKYALPWSIARLIYEYTRWY